MDEPRPPRSNKTIALVCVVFLGCMFGAAYAAVPLYNWFCRQTGYGGTTQVAEAPPTQIVDRWITVRFDANVSPDVPWRFAPEQNSIRVRLGEPALAKYRVRNLSDRTITAQASYNVTPQTTGLYFNKVQCFCFTEQTLKPHQTEELGVTFYVDPALLKDYNTANLDTITLSYTFFLTKTEPKPVAEAGSTERAVVR